MITRSELRYMRITPRKFRQVIPLVKGKNPEDAIAILMSIKKKASQIAIDLIKSAIANARRIQGVDVANLYISRMVANCGPQMKRFRAGSMGRASTIRKRTSHLIVELDNISAKKGSKPSKYAENVSAPKNAVASTKESVAKDQGKEKKTVKRSAPKKAIAGA